MSQICMAQEATRGQVADHILKVFGTEIKKVLLINPVQIPSGEFNAFLAKNKRYFAYPPYGLGVLTRVLKERGYEPNILDLNYEVLNRFHNLSEEEQQEDFDYWEFSGAVLSSRLEEFEPDLVGLTCMFTMTHGHLIALAQRLEELRPKVPMVAGGVHVSNDVERIFKDIPQIDCVCLHECESAFCDLLDFINQRADAAILSSVAVHLDDEVLRLENERPPEETLDLIPDYLDLPIESYGDLGEVGAYRFQWEDHTDRVSTVLSNRGCRARCSFCSVRNFNGKGVRRRSVESVVSEIKQLRSDKNIGHLMWLDDDLFFDESRTIKLFNQIALEVPDITWDASNGVIAAAATDKVLEAAARSGCTGMHVGIESGSPEILKKMRKPSGIKHFVKLGDTLKNYPQIFSRGFLILGYPGENLGQIVDTIELSREMALDWYTISTFTLLPETDVYEEMKQKGKLDEVEISTKKANYGSSQTGTQLKKEQMQKFRASQFQDIFTGDLTRVPDPEELSDIWFLMDYKINYERMFTENSESRLLKWQRFLVDVCDRMTKDNPMGHFFLGLLNEKLGDYPEAKHRYQMANNDLEESAYWRNRFDVLNLSACLQEKMSGPVVKTGGVGLGRAEGSV